MQKRDNIWVKIGEELSERIIPQKMDHSCPKPSIISEANNILVTFKPRKRAKTTINNILVEKTTKTFGGNNLDLLGY